MYIDVQSFIPYIFVICATHVMVLPFMRDAFNSKYDKERRVEAASAAFFGSLVVIGGSYLLL